jgi:hypothetical protein
MGTGVFVPCHLPFTADAPIVSRNARLVRIVFLENVELNQLRQIAQPIIGDVSKFI